MTFEQPAFNEATRAVNRGSSDNEWR